MRYLSLAILAPAFLVIRLGVGVLAGLHVGFKEFIMDARAIWDAHDEV